MANSNRFGSMFDDIKGDVSATEGTPAKKAKKKPHGNSKPKPKYKDPNYVQVGIYLPKDLHRRLKIGSAITQKEVSDIATEVLSKWVDKNVPDI